MKTIIRFNKDELKDYFLIGKYSDPISAFYEYLAVYSGRELDVLNGFRPNVSNVMMNKEVYKKDVLGNILKKYAKKQMPYSSDKHIELAISMLDLDIGPHTSKEVPENEIWLMDGWLMPEEE